MLSEHPARVFLYHTNERLPKNILPCLRVVKIESSVMLEIIPSIMF